MSISDEHDLSDEQVRKVLERAAHFDRTDRVKVGDLRTIALEAGISSTAVTAALSEVLAPPVSSNAEAASPRRLRDVIVERAGSWIRSTVLLAAGAAVAVPHSMPGSIDEVLPITWAALVASTVFFSVRRLDGTDEGYWRRAALPWLGYLLVGALNVSYRVDVANDFVAPTLVVAVVSLTGGLGVYRYLRRLRAGAQSQLQFS